VGHGSEHIGGERVSCGGVCCMTDALKQDRREYCEQKYP
jgi:hypothetical protein